MSWGTCRSQRRGNNDPGASATRPDFLGFTFQAALRSLTAMTRHQNVASHGDKMQNSTFPSAPFQKQQETTEGLAAPRRSPHRCCPRAGAHQLLQHLHEVLPSTYLSTLVFGAARCSWLIISDWMCRPKCFLLNLPVLEAFCRRCLLRR